MGNFLDLSGTLIGTSKFGIAQEGNALLRHALEWHPLLFILLKVGIVLLAMYALHKLQSRLGRWEVAICVLLGIVYTTVGLDWFARLAGWI